MNDVPLLFHAGSKGFVAPEAAAPNDGEVLFVAPAFQVVRRGAEARLVSAAAGVSIDHRAVEGEAKLAHRSLIVDGERQAYVFLERADPGLATVEDLLDWTLSMAVRGAEEERTRGVPGADAAPLPELPGRVPLKRGANLIGRDADAEVRLPFPLVSRRHARIDVGGDGASVVDLGSFNGTFVNGERVRRSAPTLLSPGDRIDVGPVRLVFTGDGLLVRSSSDAVEIVLDGTTKSVPVRGGEKVLVNAASLVIRPREFVAVLGPSGCGKSILLKLIGGRLVPTKGGVYVNRESLGHGSDALRKLIAYVPQRDVLHDSLRLGTALDYSARLRLPEDMTSAEREAAVAGVAQDVTLEAKDLETRIANLSGGQTRRASVANEMLSRPGLLLLDEVTSGLDEETDGELMRLFRKLADDGKTVVCVTHNLGHVPETCDHVAILAPGGELAYFGPPAEALRYFGVEKLGDVYKVLRSKPAGEWRAQYEAHPDRERFVGSRTPVVLSASAGGSGRPVWRRAKAAVRQFGLMSRRAAAVKAAQPRWIALTAVQCVGLALLLGWLFGDLAHVALTPQEEESLKRAPELIGGVSPEDLNSIPPMFRGPVNERLEKSKVTSRENWVIQKRGTLTLRLLVALVMCTLWLGCNNASAEVVKERSVFESERDVGLSVGAYLWSKILLLGLVTIAQTAVLLFVAKGLTEFEGSGAQQFALLVVLDLVGVLLGLAISAWSRTTEVSTALVPIALIPQILFAGSLIPLKALQQTIANWFVPMHWGYRGLISQLGLEEKETSLLGLVGSLPKYPESDSWMPWAVLGAHGAVLLVVCWVGLRDVDVVGWVRGLRRAKA